MQHHAKEKLLHDRRDDYRREHRHQHHVDAPRFDQRLDQRMRLAFVRDEIHERNLQRINRHKRREPPHAPDDQIVRKLRHEPQVAPIRSSDNRQQHAHDRGQRDVEPGAHEKRRRHRRLAFLHVADDVLDDDDRIVDDEARADRQRHQKPDDQNDLHAAPRHGSPRFRRHDRLAAPPPRENPKPRDATSRQ